MKDDGHPEERVGRDAGAPSDGTGGHTEAAAPRTGSATSQAAASAPGPGAAASAPGPGAAASAPGPGAAAPRAEALSPTLRHHWIVRLTHWVNVVALGVMVASGLRIFNAYPAFAPRGGTFCCYPFAGRPVPEWLTFGGWLAGARHWHFAMMWILAANGLLYLGFIYLHGEWRDLAPRRGDPRDAWEMVKFYLFVRREHPRQGKHNALQKLAYLTLVALAVLAVVSGVAIWKPVQLGWLTRLLGGYVWARYWHFVAMLGLVALALVHIFMVVSVDPYSIPAMITGRYRGDRSPERRNARPFYHLFGPGPDAGPLGEANSPDEAPEERCSDETS